MKIGDKVKFMGIDGMDQFYPMETVIVAITEHGMFMIAHPNGFIDKNNNLTVCVKEAHLRNV